MKIRLSRTFFVSVVAFLFALLALASTTLSVAATTRSNEPDFAKIDAFVTAEMQTTHIPGLALGIVHGNQIMHLQGFGVADPTGRAISQQTPFIVGSVSKSFTALAIMQLVEAGKIELDAPVQRYLPWFRLADPAASTRITVRHLLYQTSGIPASADLKEFINGTGNETLEQLVRGLNAVALDRPVGARLMNTRTRTTVCWDSSSKRSQVSPTEPISSNTSLPPCRCNTVLLHSRRQNKMGWRRAIAGGSVYPRRLICPTIVPSSLLAFSSRVPKICPTTSSCK